MSKKLKSLLSLVLALLLAISPLANVITAEAATGRKNLDVSVVSILDGNASGMYAMENAFAEKQEDGTYMVTMHQVSVNRNVMAIVNSVAVEIPEGTSDADAITLKNTAYKKAAKEDASLRIVAGGDDGYEFTFSVASLDETIYACFSSTDRIAQGKDFGNTMVITFTEQLPVVTTTPLEITNNTAMFKVTTAAIEECDGEKSLRFALNGTGYEDVFLGTYEEANATTTGTVDSSAWYHCTLNEAGKFEFVVPLQDGQEVVNVATLSASSITAGTYKWYPRQFVIDYENNTMTTGDYENGEDMEQIKHEDSPEINCDKFDVQLYTIAGPISNNYEVGVELQVKEAGIKGAELKSIVSEATLSTEINDNGALRFALLKNKKGGIVEYDYFEDSFELTIIFDDDTTEVWNAHFNRDTLKYYIAKEIEYDDPSVTDVFSDVKEGAWYVDSVQYVYDMGIMKGMGDGTQFAPAAKLSRAQFATILWRMAGAPEVEVTDKFPDVKKGAFYDQAVIWANQKGIINGYDSGCFGPADNITREQMAVMMFRYAKTISGYDIDTRADLSAFTDALKVSKFATDAMSWCNGLGIITGKTTTTLDPQGKASRAECATIIMRFCRQMPPV